MIDTAVEHTRLQQVGLSLDESKPFENTRYYPLHEIHGPTGETEPISGPVYVPHRKIPEETPGITDWPPPSYTEAMYMLNISPELAEVLLQQEVPLRNLASNRKHILPEELLPEQGPKSMVLNDDTPTAPVPQPPQPTETTEVGHVLLECKDNKFHFDTATITESCLNVIREDPSISLDPDLITPQTIAMKAPTTYMFIGPQEGAQMISEMGQVTLYEMDEKCRFKVTLCDKFGRVSRSEGHSSSSFETAAQKAAAIKAHLERKRMEEKARTIMFYHNLTPGSTGKALENGQLGLEIKQITDTLKVCLGTQMRATTRVEQLQKDGYIQPRLRSWTLFPSPEMMPKMKDIDWTPLKFISVRQGQKPMETVANEETRNLLGILRNQWKQLPMRKPETFWESCHAASKNKTHTVPH